jgi:hypothetical protein
LYALAEGEVLDYAKLFPDAQADARQLAIAALEAQRDRITTDLQLASEGADRIVEAIERGTDTPRMRARLAKLEGDIAENEAKLPDIQSQIERERAKPRDTEQKIGDTRRALREFIDTTWRRSTPPGEAFGFSVEEGHSVGDKALSIAEARELREKLHHQLRGVVSEITFKANGDGSGRIVLALHPQGQLALALDRGDRTAVPDDPDLVPPMELEDVPLASGKGLGRGRITKALLNVYLDGDIEGDAGAVVSYAV